MCYELVTRQGDHSYLSQPIAACENDFAIDQHAWSNTMQNQMTLLNGSSQVHRIDAGSLHLIRDFRS